MQQILFAQQEKRDLLHVATLERIMVVVKSLRRDLSRCWYRNMAAVGRDGQCASSVRVRNANESSIGSRSSSPAAFFRQSARMQRFLRN
jgi:hypothetical protein